MSWSVGSEFENNGNKLNWRNGKHHRRPSVMSSLVVIHPVNNTCTTVFKSKAEYTNTQQDLTVR
jgi:hypothetical protein